YKIGPIFTPPTVSKAEGPLGTLQLAINGGGTVWAGGSYDPETHIMYVYSRRSPGVLGLVKPDPAKNDMNYVQGSALTGARAGVAVGAGRGRGPRPPPQRLRRLVVLPRLLVVPRPAVARVAEEAVVKAAAAVSWSRG